MCSSDLAMIDDGLADIASNCGALDPLTEDEIDSLCERLNFTEAS